jgi:adenine deaminase
LLSDVEKLQIVRVWADGKQISEGTTYLPEVPTIAWPEWATRTVNIQRDITAADFAIKAAPDRTTMNAAVIRPFHWHRRC